MPNVIDKAVQWAINIAKDDSHGYSQANRWGFPDYDCSSFVISAYDQAFKSFGLSSPKDYGATYTGNMLSPFVACGFKAIDIAEIRQGEKLVKGDVLLNVVNHTCIYIGNNQVVNCRTDEDGRSGDSSGNEIRIQAYWDFPWNYILRYVGDEEDHLPDQGEDPDPKEEKILMPNNSKGIGVAMLQGGLKYLGYNLGKYGIDGDGGLQHSYTNTALKQAVSKGQISEETVKYLLSLKRG